MSKVTQLKNPKPVTLESLAEAWLRIKEDEKAIVLRRYAIEALITERTGVKDEGSETHKHGDFKLVVEGSITRKIDKDVLTTIWDELPEAVRDRLFPTEPKLDLKEMRYLQANEPDIYALAAKAIVAKPGKPGVKVERIPPQAA